ncbi:Histidine kinase-, DNA gyrase B-, and HSP90-like ATPase [Desulfitobacterium chlororespirans DSM 11544]|uniref:Histidine kinase-, DNA gyrase B-, and HSP90-like ATPase n=1 Tax=Desulfitobacterium chlororespirans DSM 11544 TaxID=1121395 RepID=A0A1M7SM28_9FIRM|nr:Histidine kinase-, DNA gyrase B-, and HSP90-like ATPase [Desulfitobacterium chlororespirans DSM 11544]
MLFEREDWKLFRNMETLTQKAGVPKSKLSMLVCKELADNALDVCGQCEIGFEDGFFYVRDQGPGLDPALFSINRPLRSSKYLRLPTRGALGNGLRVVAGAVAASGGELYVSTRGRRYRIHFQPDGTARPENLGDAQEMGTKISFQLGRLPINSSWAQTAVRYAGGESYRGRTSPWWYTSENFFELFQAFGGTVRELIQQLTAAPGAKGGKSPPSIPKLPPGT